MLITKIQRYLYLNSQPQSEAHARHLIITFYEKDSHQNIKADVEESETEAGA